MVLWIPKKEKEGMAWKRKGRVDKVDVHTERTRHASKKKEDTGMKFAKLAAAPAA